MNNKRNRSGYIVKAPYISFHRQLVYFRGYARTQIFYFISHTIDREIESITL